MCWPLSFPVSVFSLCLCLCLSSLLPAKAHLDFTGLQEGVCLVPFSFVRQRNVMDRSTNKWKYEEYNQTVMRVDCCSGYRTESEIPLRCSPVCDPPCENSDCMAPDTCVCHPRHVMINNSNSTCYDVCDSCVGGSCTSPNDLECTCHSGYIRDLRFPHICDPVCPHECVNATCIAPSLCKCYDGYKSSEDLPDNICVPHCEEECVFGECTEPNVCTCFDGYINDEDSPSICLPECNRTCVYGECAAPGTCKCQPGFRPFHGESHHCVPMDSCALTVPQIIRFDNRDCYEINGNIPLVVNSSCELLEKSETLCSKNCHSKEDCEVFNLKCYMVKWDDWNVIRCRYPDTVEAAASDESTRADIIMTNTSVWTDAILILTDDIPWYLVGNKENSSTYWSLHPLSKERLCGKEFEMEVRECKALLRNNGHHVNSSFMFWMNIILLFGFLLLAGAGVGGFLWVRHRKLNDPLNYRGDMNQGFYNNECYDSHENQPVVCDDDSCSDGPLDL